MIKWSHFELGRRVGAPRGTLKVFSQDLEPNDTRLVLSCVSSTTGFYKSVHVNISSTPSLLCQFIIIYDQSECD